MKILLVDDNPIDLLINNKIVTTLNASAEVVKKQSAEEALHYIQELGAEDTLPHYILLDIKMPIMDGFGLLDALKPLQDKLKKNTKIIMVSSSIDPMDRNRAAENMLVYDFLEKPLTVEKLKSCPSIAL